MIYIPEIYPDELMFSWFCRIYVHNGYLACSDALKDILNSRSNSPSVEFVGHLNDIMFKMITDMYDIQNLILKHTMFPYYARFIPLEQKKNALKRLCYDYDDVHHLFSVLPRKEGDKCLNFCPLCVKEDRSLYGETYWHRIHQIRGVTSCIKHNCKLIDFDMDILSKPLFALYPAETNVNDSAFYKADVDKLKFDRYMTEVFLSEMNFDFEVPINALIFNAMKNTVYIKSSGRTRYTKKFVEDLESFYRKIGVKSVVSIHQIERTFLGIRFNFSVICQLGYFMNIDADTLVNSKLSKKEILEEKMIHSPRKKVCWADLDDISISKVESIVKEMYYGDENRRPEKITIRQLNKKMNWNQNVIGNLPKCMAIVKSYSESYEENYARRLIWAYEKLSHDNIHITWTMLSRISGVKKEKVKAVVPFIYAYVGAETADTIVKMATGQI